MINQLISQRGYQPKRQARLCDASLVNPSYPLCWHSLHNIHHLTKKLMLFPELGLAITGMNIRDIFHGFVHYFPLVICFAASLVNSFTFCSSRQAFTCIVRYSPEVTSHLLETFSLLLARVPLELTIYQVKSISF